MLGKKEPRKNWDRLHCRSPTRALKILPNEHSAWRLHAELLVANQQPRKAIESALRVRELNSSDPISELLLGYCYEASGDNIRRNPRHERERKL